MEVSGAVSTTSASFRPTKDYTIAFGRAYKSKPLSLKRAIPVSTGKTDVAGDPYSNSRRPRIFPTKQLELQNPLQYQGENRRLIKTYRQKYRNQQLFPGISEWKHGIDDNKE
ncbi:unnamed protein product [Leptidea sinapis]|uniref:Uncharacterized protein n=1 Tax=Leptidea sinapis TaxID=189913 RepID=A0A5E4QQD0_9NEOP|nr:unnamed protein product [Leptidea sinapis]